MIVDAILIGLICYLSIPAIAGYCAYQFGRSFWFWFGLSLVIPLIAQFILVTLILIDEAKTPSNKLSKSELRRAEDMVKEVIDEISSKPSVQEKGAEDQQVTAAKKGYDS